ncbi:MAG: hypothetical protein K9I82_01915 [Chitinophagaceae bacterium]|nr:hypothetical protein [Chitinophagaceae bacterium]
MKSTQELIEIKSQAGIQLTDRELAVRWYGRLSDVEQLTLLDKYIPSFLPDELSDENKYWLWLKQQKL